jgi:hypothetical protein
VTLTPIKQNSATCAHKWFKEYMAIANTAGWNGVYSDVPSCQMKIGIKKDFPAV